MLERSLNGGTLSCDDVTHYGKIVVTLRETIHLMAEIDELIPSWPMELDLETSEVSEDLRGLDCGPQGDHPLHGGDRRSHPVLAD